MHHLLRRPQDVDPDGSLPHRSPRAVLSHADGGRAQDLGHYQEGHRGQGGQIQSGGPIPRTDGLSGADVCDQSRVRYSAVQGVGVQEIFQGGGREVEAGAERRRAVERGGADVREDLLRMSAAPGIRPDRDLRGPDHPGPPRPSRRNRRPAHPLHRGQARIVPRDHGQGRTSLPYLRLPRRRRKSRPRPRRDTVPRSFPLLGILHDAR
mmetsp:Transcript_30383/g.90623  ORF Transcript_30383/g.90623 Transcript_30383/m.90623 type:complete len:208 (+) Transcript_30383:1215-1838(+)